MRWLIAKADFSEPAIVKAPTKEDAILLFDKQGKWGIWCVWMLGNFPEQYELIPAENPRPLGRPTIGSKDE